MLDILASGRLVKPPQTRISAKGAPFTTALLAVATEGEENRTLVSVIAFGEAADKLSKLKQGDSASVAGSAKLSAWTGNDGIEKHGLSLTAQQVMSVYEVRKRRGGAEKGDDEPKASAAKPEPASADFDDEVPF